MTSEICECGHKETEHNSWNGQTGRWNKSKCRRVIGERFDVNLECSCKKYRPKSENHNSHQKVGVNNSTAKPSELDERGNGNVGSTPTTNTSGSGNIQNSDLNSNEEIEKIRVRELRREYGKRVFVNKMDININDEDKPYEWLIQNFGLFCFQAGRKSLATQNEENAFLRENYIKECQEVVKLDKQLEAQKAEMKKQFLDMIDNWYKKMERKRKIYTDPQIIGSGEIKELKSEVENMK